MAKATEDQQDQQRTLTQYVVLGYQVTEEEVANPAYSVLGNGEGLSSDVALRKVAGDVVREGETWELVAIPARSFRPERLGIERPAPRLVRQ